jgi:hypothetical protein
MAWSRPAKNPWIRSASTAVDDGLRPGHSCGGQGERKDEERKLLQMKTSFWKYKGPAMSEALLGRVSNGIAGLGAQEQRELCLQPPVVLGARDAQTDPAPQGLPVGYRFEAGRHTAERRGLQPLSALH